MTGATHASAPGYSERSVRAPAWVLQGGAIVGGAAIAIGLAHDAPRVWANLLIDGFLVVALALGGLAFVAIHHLSGATWSAGMRRVAEALTCVLPLAAAAMLALFIGRSSLYPWAAGAHRPAGAASSTGTWFFAPAIVFARMGLFLAMWTACAVALRRSSDRQDESPAPVHHRRAIRRSAIFAVLFAWSFPVAAVDWLLSLNPEWTSTIFFVYVFAGVLVEGVAAITLATVILRERGLLRDVVTDSHLHDLGKLLFAFTTFWAYIWLCQYLLIWYGNLPDEAGYYQTRTGPGWLVWFAANVIVNWVIPFLALLPRAAKRSARTLKVVSGVLLVGRWIDVYLLVAPETSRTAVWGALEVAIAAGYACVAWWWVSRALAARPLIVRHDPCLAECLQHHQ
jgi:hypothetical protein